MYHMNLGDIITALMKSETSSDLRCFYALCNGFGHTQVRVILQYSKLKIEPLMFIKNSFASPLVFLLYVPATCTTLKNTAGLLHPQLNLSVPDVFKVVGWL